MVYEKYNQRGAKISPMSYRNLYLCVWKTKVRKLKSRQVVFDSHSRMSLFLIYLIEQYTELIFVSHKDESLKIETRFLLLNEIKLNIQEIMF